MPKVKVHNPRVRFGPRVPNCRKFSKLGSKPNPKPKSKLPSACTGTCGSLVCSPRLGVSCFPYAFSSSALQRSLPFLSLTCHYCRMPRPPAAHAPSPRRRGKHSHIDVDIDDDSEDTPPSKKAKKTRASSIPWKRPSHHHLTWRLIEAMEDPTMRHQLFSDDRKEAKKQKRSVVVGSVTKVVLHGRLAKAIFGEDAEYKEDYRKTPATFTSSVHNRLCKFVFYTTPHPTSLD